MRQGALELQERAADLVAERGVALLMVHGLRMGVRAAAAEEAVAAGCGCGCGGVVGCAGSGVVMTERHFGFYLFM